MRSFFKLLLFLTSPFISHSHAMLFTGEVMISPDQSRYITLLGHHHRQTGWDHEGRQIDELIAICKEGVQEGKKFHILYEKIGPITRFLLPERSMLGDIEQDFANAQVPDCTFENIEIRDVSGAALDIFNPRRKVFEPLLPCGENSKTYGEVTFQDLFDEFESHAGKLEAFALNVVQEHPECPNVDLIHFKYTGARKRIDQIKQFLKENALFENEKLIDVALARKDDCLGFYRATRDAFNDLLELHILRRLLQLDPHIQPVVITGAMHTQMVYQSLDELRWQARLYKGDLFTETPVPLDYQTLRSFVLNETKWERVLKTTFTYWASLKVALVTRYQTLREAIISRYCK